ncbi:hypothetical protein WCLP8_470004 [uncultured Gammaproteobacteria bacterium]
MSRRWSALVAGWRSVWWRHGSVRGGCRRKVSCRHGLSAVSLFVPFQMKWVQGKALVAEGKRKVDGKGLIRCTIWSWLSLARRWSTMCSIFPRWTTSSSKTCSMP